MTPERAAIRAFILAKFLPGESSANLRDTLPLVSSGILDSLAVLELAGFVQREFGIELAASETIAESFDSIERIAGLVARKRVA